MILKSMSRKSPSFRQLGNYIRRGSQPDFPWITHNVLSPDDDLNAIITEFEENARRMKRRKGGNVLYHEVLSASVKDGKVTPEILEDMAREHIARRAKGAMVIAKVHMEPNKPPHVHMMISASDLRGRKIRLSIAELKEHQRALEKYQLEQWPELEHSILFSPEQEKRREREREGINQRNDYRREEAQRNSREIQTERRLEVEAKELGKPKPPKKKDLLRSQIETALNVKNREDFEKRLAMCNPPMKLYQRGKTWGVIRTEIPKPTKGNPTPEPKEVKYRLNTLGIDFEARLREWERKQEIEKVLQPTVEVPQKIQPTPEIIQPLPPVEKIVESVQPELSLEEKRLQELKAIRNEQKLKKDRERERNKQRKRDLDR